MLKHTNLETLVKRCAAFRKVYARISVRLSWSITMALSQRGVDILIFPIQQSPINTAKNWVPFLSSISGGWLLKDESLRICIHRKQTIVTGVYSTCFWRSGTEVIQVLLKNTRWGGSSHSEGDPTGAYKYRPTDLWSHQCEYRKYYRNKWTHWRMMNEDVKRSGFGKDALALFLCWRYRLFYHSWLTLMQYNCRQTCTSVAATGSGLQRQYTDGCRNQLSIILIISAFAYLARNRAPCFYSDRAAGYQELRRKIMKLLLYFLIITALVLTIAVASFSYTTTLYILSKWEIRQLCTVLYNHIYCFDFLSTLTRMNAFISRRNFNRISMPAICIGNYTNIILFSSITLIFVFVWWGAAFCELYRRVFLRLESCAFWWGKRTVWKLRAWAISV